MWRLYWGIAEAFFSVLRLELGRLFFFYIEKYYYMYMCSLSFSRFAFRFGENF